MHHSQIWQPARAAIITRQIAWQHHFGAPAPVPAGYDYEANDLGFCTQSPAPMSEGYDSGANDRPVSTEAPAPVPVQVNPAKNYYGWAVNPQTPAPMPTGFDYEQNAWTVATQASAPVPVTASEALRVTVTATAPVPQWRPCACRVAWHADKTKRDYCKARRNVKEGRRGSDRTLLRGCEERFFGQTEKGSAFCPTCCDALRLCKSLAKGCHREFQSRQINAGRTMYAQNLPLAHTTCAGTGIRTTLSAA